MIEAIFQFGPDIILVRVSGNQILFGNTSQGAQMAPLSGLKLSKSGVIKEFPELEDNPNWNGVAVEKFKEKIKELKTERAKIFYIIGDLRKHGYIPKKLREAGKRPINIT